MSGYAIFRLPHAQSATLIKQTEGEPEEYYSCTELNGRSGFVLAPFQVTDDEPILLIRPDETTVVDLHASDNGTVFTNKGTGASRTNSNPPAPSPDYTIDFANFHTQLQLGYFRKIVLSRCTTEPLLPSATPMMLFRKACELYPRMFISLVSTKKSGTWLTATPEILLEGSGHNWRTIALAGTMQLTEEQLSGEGETVRWSTKNIQEQHYVATYLTQCLEQFTNDFHEEGPYTVRAANLVHLRSDFNFTLLSNHHIGNILQRIHPTPAVCGLPKREAFQFITHNEHSPRHYYSGFMGLLQPEAETHLYVSLRCMNICADCYHLYAGGGLMKDSTLEQEWLETEAKLSTMRNVLQ